MKHTLKLALIAIAFSFGACNSSSHKEEATEHEIIKTEEITIEKTTKEHAEETMSETALADHVCTDKCTADGGCFFKCGEKGHKCTGECHAKEGEHSDEGEAHEHEG